MKDIGIVYGTAEQAVPIFIGNDTVYVHSDIEEIDLVDMQNVIIGKQYRYHEIQYELQEYILFLSQNIENTNKKMDEFIFSIEKGMK